MKFYFKSKIIIHSKP